MERSLSNHCFALCTISVLGGCTTGPALQYTKVTDQTQESTIRGLIQFALNDSLITLSKPTVAVGKAADSPADLGLTTQSNVLASQLGELQAIVSPTVGADRYVIRPQDSMWGKTKLTVTYFDNTQRLRKIGVQFEDRTVKFIQAVGGVAKAFIPLRSARISPLADSLAVPVVVEAKARTWTSIPNNAGWEYRVTLANPPKSTTQAQDFFSQYQNETTDLFPFSACVQAHLEIRNNGQNSTSFPVTIADSSLVGTYALPAKGSVELHSVCNANLTVEATHSGSESALAALEEIFKQIQAIKDAQGK